MKKKRNPVAKELYTPKYKSKVIPNKKKGYMSDDDYNLLIVYKVFFAW